MCVCVYTHSNNTLKNMEERGREIVQEVALEVILKVLMGEGNHASKLLWSFRDVKFNSILNWVQ